jgi:hypothetical protein
MAVRIAQKKREYKDLPGKDLIREGLVVALPDTAVWYDQDG